KVQDVERILDSARSNTEKIAPDSPLGKKGEGTAESANSSLKALRERRRPDVARQVHLKALSDLDKSIQDSEQRLKSQELQMEQMKVELDRAGDEAEALGIQSSDLKMRRTEVDNAEVTLKSLHEQRNKLKVEIQSERHRVTLLQPAEPPDHLVRKKQISGAALSAISFFVLGIFGITYLDVRERKISTPDDVVQDLGLRVVGVFPSMADRGRPARRLRSSVPDGEYWDTILNES